MNPLVSRRHSILQRAIGSGLLHPDKAPLVYFIDETTLGFKVNALLRAFAGETEVQNALAVKAGSLPVLLRMHRDFGMGTDVASEGELQMALRVEHAGESIVFDSPVKTKLEL